MAEALREATSNFRNEVLEFEDGYHNDFTINETAECDRLWQVALAVVAWGSATLTTLIGEKLYYPVLKGMRQDYLKASNRHVKVDYSSPPTEQGGQVMQAMHLHRHNPGMNPAPRAEADTMKDLAAITKTKYYQGGRSYHGTLVLHGKDCKDRATKLHFDPHIEDQYETDIK